MDFKEQLLALADRVAKNKEAVKTIEAMSDIYKVSKELKSIVEFYLK